MTKNNLPSQDYQFGFHDEDVSVYKTKKGISKEIVEEISKIKGEPQWMTDFRLKAFEVFESKPMPPWGPSLESIKFEDYTYYIKPSARMENKWEDVPVEIKATFDRLGIPEAEKKFLSGVATQYESEMVYHNMLQEVQDKGVIFTDTDSGLRLHPELFKKFFGSVVPYTDNKFAALNSAVWSGGSFIYVPPGVKLDKPLQSYFRINSEQMGQFERTLIVADEGAYVSYMEGCTAPMRDENQLHAAIVEIVAMKDAEVKYSTVQNWYPGNKKGEGGIYNFVTKRGI